MMAGSLRSTVKHAQAKQWPGSDVWKRLARQRTRPNLVPGQPRLPTHGSIFASDIVVGSISGATMRVLSKLVMKYDAHS
jgi:hypothetical protein